MKKNLLSIVLTLAFALAACTPTTAKPTSAPTTVPANFPTGKFVKSDKTNYGYIFNEDGTWSNFDGFFMVVRGTYSVDGNVYTETSNDGACESNISFTYTFDGTNLTFNYVGVPEEDRCINRTWDMDNVTYTRAGAEQSNFPVGKFIKSGTTDYGLIFNEDGTFNAFNRSITLVHATYKVDGNVFTETSNDGGCETNVSFNYVFDGKNLTFTYVGSPDDDLACDGRHADFNNVTYTLSE